MIFKLIERLPLTDGGAYYATLESAQDVTSKGSKAQCVLTFNLTDEEDNPYQQAKLWIGDTIEPGTIEHELFGMLDMFSARRLNTETLIKRAEGVELGVVVKKNEKSGKTYWNISEFFNGEDDLEDHDVSGVTDEDDELEDEEEEEGEDFDEE